MKHDEINQISDALNIIKQILHRHSYVGLEGATLTLPRGWPVKGLLGDEGKHLIMHDDKHEWIVFEGMRITWPAEPK